MILEFDLFSFSLSILAVYMWAKEIQYRDRRRNEKRTKRMFDIYTLRMFYRDYISSDAELMARGQKHFEALQAELRSCKRIK